MEIYGEREKSHLYQMAGGSNIGVQVDRHTGPCGATAVI